MASCFAARGHHGRVTALLIEVLRPATTGPPKNQGRLRNE